jgi:hypothetical protein
MKDASPWVSIYGQDFDAGQFSYQSGSNSLMFSSRQYEWGNGQAIELRPDGYPSMLHEWQTVISLAMRDVCLHATAGRYVVLYDGDGEIDFGMDAVSAAFQHGRIDVDFLPTCERHCWFDKDGWRPYCSDNGMAVRISRTNPANPIRNIRLITPGFLDTYMIQPFHPFFLRSLEMFSALRFMDWQRTNSDFVVDPVPVRAQYVRLIPTRARAEAESVVHMSEVHFFTNEIGWEAIIPASATSAGVVKPELIDNDHQSDAQVGLDAPVEFDFGAEVAIASYSWKTAANWDVGRDPVRWRLEVRASASDQWVTVHETLTDIETTLERSMYPIPAEGQSNAAQQCLVCNNDNRGRFPMRDPTNPYPLRWEDRTLPGDRLQTTANGGVALEYIVLLANTLGTNAWVCIHHLADDDYIRNFAAFFLEHLRPDVKLSVEHSNEVWSTGFPQGRFAHAEGMRMGLHDDGTPCVSFGYCARLRYHAKRSVEIFEIFKDVWGDANRHRLTFVLATQAVVPFVTEELLSWQDTYQHVDVVATAGYFSPVETIDNSWSIKTPEEIHSALSAGASAFSAELAAQKEVALRYNVPLTTYEAGPGLVEHGVIGGGRATGAVTEALIAAVRDPAMEAIVEQFVDIVQAADAMSAGSAERPLMWFTSGGVYSKYGTWGLQEFTDQEPSPKARGLMNIIARSAPFAHCVSASRNQRFGYNIDPSNRSMVGAPQVSSPKLNDTLVSGQRYMISWDAGWHGRPTEGSTVDLKLWRTSTCPSTLNGEGAGFTADIANAIPNVGEYGWVVPDGLPVAPDYFVEIRSTVQDSSNYSEPFWIVPPDMAPPVWHLHIEKDVDLLSAFHRNCKQENKDWAVVPHFRIDSCVYTSAEGCRSYRTFRHRDELDMPPYLHGSFKPVKDCVLRVVGVRSTMALEGLTRSFDLDAKAAIARVIARQADIPAGSVQLLNTRTAGGFGSYSVGDCRSKDCIGGRRHLQNGEIPTSVEFELLIVSNDATAAQASLLLEGLGNGTDAATVEEMAREIGEATGSDTGVFAVAVTSLSASDLEQDTLAEVIGSVVGGTVCAPGEWILNTTMGEGSDAAELEACQLCPAGTFSDGVDAMCFACPPHSFSARNGSATCDPCPAGTWQPDSGGTSCVPLSCGFVSLMAKIEAGDREDDPLLAGCRTLISRWFTDSFLVRSACRGSNSCDFAGVLAHPEEEAGFLRPCLAVAREMEAGLSQCGTGASGVP